jgi:hypothetical protein
MHRADRIVVAGGRLALERDPPGLDLAEPEIQELGDRRRLVAAHDRLQELDAAHGGSGGLLIRHRALQTPLRGWR